MRWLQSFIDRQVPHVLVAPKNPVFDYELRNMSGPKTRAELKKAAGTTLGTIFVMASVGLILLLWENLSALRRADWMSELTGSCLTIVGILGLLSIFVTIAVDLYYVLITSNSIGQHLVSGQWDILRLSPLGTQAILDGKYAVTLIRVWQAMSIDFSFRVATIAFIFFASILSSVLFVRSMQEILILLPYGILFFVLGVLPAAGLWILEPLWRMRAFVAVGLMASAQFHNPSFAALSGLGYWMGLRLLQIVILVVSMFVSALFFPIVVILILAVTYIFYDVVLYNALNRTLKFAFRSE